MPVFCATCDCNPCMCGRREYGTEQENRRHNERKWLETYGDEEWAMPAHPMSDPECEIRCDAK